MRALSRNNNTTTRLKRGPNPLSGVVILVLIFFFFGLFFLVYFVYFFCLYFIIFFGFFLDFLDFWIFLSLFFYLFIFFVCVFFLFVFFFVVFFISIFVLYLRLYVVPLGTTTTDHQVPRLQRSPNPLSGILIPRPPRDNHNKPSSPQATERS